MSFNYLALAVPLFLFFMGLEYLYARRKGRSWFRFAESIANLNVGIAERLLDLLVTGLFFYVFSWIHTHARLFDIRPAVWTWILLFLLTDLVWYWYHRLAHEINLFWAAHVVHHQSEDFNYTVSARITVFQALLRGAFWSVLPWLGFPAPMVTALLLVHGLYPFFIHTQALGRWGWLEHLLVTPTHHGLHHASNPEYLDSNYGDVLIIWDKLFGTFAAPRPGVVPVYGLTRPLHSHSFLWQHFHFLLEIWMNVRRATSFRQRWKAFFGRPDDLDPRCRTLLERRLLNVERHRPPTAAMRVYVQLQTGTALVLLFLVLLFEKQIPVLHMWMGGAFILLSLVSSGAILDQRRWVAFPEILKIGLLASEIALLFPGRYTYGLLAALLCVLVWFFHPLERRYRALLFKTSSL